MAVPQLLSASDLILLALLPEAQLTGGRVGGHARISEAAWAKNCVFVLLFVFFFLKILH